MKKKVRARNDTSFKAKKVAKEKAKKARVKFTFITDLGIKLDNETSRIKIAMDGGVSCLIKDEEDKWISVKGKLLTIKIVMEKAYAK